MNLTNTPEVNTKCDKISLYFKHNDKLTKVNAIEGDSIMETAHKNDIPLEGACEGSLACSTCHVYYDRSLKNLLDKNISEKENDLLDKAYGLRDNSRLGCQIKVNKELYDKVFELPRATINFAVDGHVPKPH